MMQFRVQAALPEKSLIKRTFRTNEIPVRKVSLPQQKQAEVKSTSKPASCPHYVTDLVVSGRLCAMWKSIKDYFTFCGLAFAEKFPSRRYTLLKKIVWPLLVFVVAWVLHAYFGIPLKSVVVPIYNLLPGLAWIIIVLGIVIGFLLCLIDGARRYHKKTVAHLTDALTDKIKQRSSRLKELCEVYGRAYQLNRQFSPEVERPTPGALQHLAERLRKALWACYGPAGTEKFTEGKNYYSVTVPEDESKHSEWVYNTYLRLGDLINEESPK